MPSSKRDIVTTAVTGFDCEYIRKSESTPSLRSCACKSRLPTEWVWTILPFRATTVTTPGTWPVSTAFAITDDKRIFAAADATGSVLLWRIADGRPVGQLRHFNDRWQSWSADGTWSQEMLPAPQ